MSYDYTGEDLNFKISNEIITPSSLTDGCYVLAKGAYYIHNLSVIDTTTNEEYLDYIPRVPEAVGSAKTGKGIFTILDLSQWTGEELSIS